MEHVADGVGRPDSYEQTVGGLVKAICEKPFVEDIQSLFDDLGERIQLSSVAADACLLVSGYVLFTHSIRLNAIE